MITLYSGRPGSGKSLDVLRVIKYYSKRGRHIVCNFRVNLPYVQYIDNTDLTPFNILDFFNRFERTKRENNYLLVIDECQTIFNSRTWQKNTAMGWIPFMTQHRKYGIEIILIAQDAGMIDKQIRQCIELVAEHRRCSRFGVFGCILGLVLGDYQVLVRWAGIRGKDGIVGRYSFRGSKKMYALYDSYAIFGG